MFGNFVYVSTGWDNVEDLQVIDVSDPKNPKRVGGNSAVSATCIAVSDSHVFTATEK